jgi:hypothetical protein
MKKAITPIKGIHELFEPIIVRMVRYKPEGIHDSDFKTLFSIFPIYIEIMKNSMSQEDFTELAEEFVQTANISDQHQKENWANFIRNQLDKFKEYRELLEESYTTQQINEVIEAAISTGKAIKDFYEKRI